MFRWWLILAWWGLVADVAGAEELPRRALARELAPGLRVERVQAPTSRFVRRAPLVTLVRIDPARYSFHLLTSEIYGGKRTPPEWIEEFSMTGVINASMYLPNLRSAGLMVDGDRVNNGYDNPSYGGFIAFDPVEPDLPAVTLVGRDCHGFDLGRLRRQYRTVFQSYRLLDCEGNAIAWRDPKLYSAAAIGIDADGRLVMVHTGRAWRMSELAQWLAEETDLAGAVFVEGGPQAGLVVETVAGSIAEIGQYELPIPTSGRFRAIPNVLGFRARP